MKEKGLQIGRFKGRPHQPQPPQNVAKKSQLPNLFLRPVDFAHGPEKCARIQLGASASDTIGRPNKGTVMSFRSDNRVIRPSLLLGVSMAALLAGSPAFAQTVDTAQPTDTTEPDATTPEAPAPAAPQAAPEDTTATIVVTGSRIRQPEFTSPDPVALIDPTMSKREG